MVEASSHKWTETESGPDAAETLGFSFFLNIQEYVIFLPVRSEF